MAYNNSNLFYNKSGVPGAHIVDVLADGGANTDINGTTDSDVFVFQTGNTGDDTIFGFNRNDSLISHSKIFDGNNDGIITLGNNVLDIDRFGYGDTKTGNDQIILLRTDGSAITDLRYLGTKEGVKDYVYADADTRFALDALNGDTKVKEGFVSSDTLSGAGGKFDFLYDTALGLNLGGDKITSFGLDDHLVTTVKLFDGNGDGFIEFGKNGILDLAGELQGPGTYTGADIGPAGQITFDASVTKLALVSDTLGTNGVHYYIYGDATLSA